MLDLLCFFWSSLRGPCFKFLCLLGSSPGWAGPSLLFPGPRAASRTRSVPPAVVECYHCSIGEVHQQIVGGWIWGRIPSKMDPQQTSKHRIHCQQLSGAQKGQVSSSSPSPRSVPCCGCAAVATASGAGSDCAAAVARGRGRRGHHGHGRHDPGDVGGAVPKAKHSMHLDLQRGVQWRSLGSGLGARGVPKGVPGCLAHFVELPLKIVYRASTCF